MMKAWPGIRLAIGRLGMIQARGGALPGGVVGAGGGGVALWVGAASSARRPGPSYGTHSQKANG